MADDFQSSADKEHGNEVDDPMSALRSGSNEERRAADGGPRSGGRKSSGSKSGGKNKTRDEKDVNAVTGEDDDGSNDKKKNAASGKGLKLGSKLVKKVASVLKAVQAGGLRALWMMFKAFAAVHGIMAAIIMAVVIFVSYAIATIISFFTVNEIAQTDVKVEPECYVYVEKAAIGHRNQSIGTEFLQEETARRIYSILSYYGFRPEQSFAVLGNWERESSLDPTAVEAVFGEDFTIGEKKQNHMYYDFVSEYCDYEFWSDPDNKDTYKKGVGLGQWTNVYNDPSNPSAGASTRNTDLMNYASVAGHGVKVDPVTDKRVNGDEEGTFYMGDTNMYLQWYDVIVQMAYALDDTAPPAGTTHIGDTSAPWMIAFADIGSKHMGSGNVNTNEFDGDSAIQITLPNPSPGQDWDGLGCDEGGPHAAFNIRVIDNPSGNPDCVPQTGFGTGHPINLFPTAADHGIPISWADIKSHGGNITVYPYAQKDPSQHNDSALALAKRGYDMKGSTDDDPVHNFWTDNTVTVPSASTPPINAHIGDKLDFHDLHQADGYSEASATVNYATVGISRDTYYDMGVSPSGHSDHFTNANSNQVIYTVGESGHTDAYMEDGLGTGVDAIRQHCAELATRYCDIKCEELLHWDNPEEPGSGDHYYYDYIAEFPTWRMVNGTKVNDAAGHGWFHYEPSAYIQDWTWFYRLKMSQYMCDYYTAMFLDEWEGNPGDHISERVEYAENFLRRWWESTLTQHDLYWWYLGDESALDIGGWKYDSSPSQIPEDIWNVRTVAQLDAMKAEAEANDDYNKKTFGFRFMTFVEPNLTGDGQVGTGTMARANMSSWEATYGGPSLDKFFKVESGYGRGVEYMIKDTIDGMPIEFQDKKTYTYDLDMRRCEKMTYITNNAIAEAACSISYSKSHPPGDPDGIPRWKALVQRMANYENDNIGKYTHDSTGRNIHWDPALYQSCDITACLAIRISGCDDTFPKGPTLETMEYLVSSPRWTEIDWGGDVNQLQPGDVLMKKDSIRGGASSEIAGRGDEHHVAIYVSNETAKRMLGSQAVLDGIDRDHITGAVVEGSFEDHCPWLTDWSDRFAEDDYHVFRCTNPQDPVSSKFYGW